MVIFKKLFPSNFQFSKIILEYFVQHICPTMKYEYGRWLIWAQTEQEQIPTQKFDLDQVKIQK